MITVNSQVENELLEAAFYAKPYSFSYTSLNKLITSPASFYKEYILKDKEDEFKKYLLEGTLIHFLVLENQDFDSKFIVMPENLPSSNTISVVERIFDENSEKILADPTLQLVDFEDEVDTILTEIKLHQNVKDKAKRIAKIVEPKAEEYFNILRSKDRKTVIDSALLDKCTRRADIVKANVKMRELLGLDIISDGKLYGVYNELELSMEPVKDMPFGYKGILDNLVVDVVNKTVRINDFKTTGKTLVDFPQSVDFWNYWWLQPVIYLKLVRNYLREVIDPTWKFEFKFIVFDKYDQLYAYPVSRETLDEWSVRFKKIEKEALYHYESRDYSLPYNFAQGIVEL
jgi:hypothetical protein